VIGNGMAGVATVEELLSLYQGPAWDGQVPHITIFGEEPDVNYNRILLSDVLAGRRTIDSIYLNSRQWYEEHRIDLRSGVKVTAIDTVAKSVIDTTGAATGFDGLLLAVGATPFIPPIAGMRTPGVYVFRSTEDTQNIVCQARQGKRAVVLGGGLLGLEAARALVNYGLSVTVVHLMDRLMEQQLDPFAAAMLKREIEQFGIEVRLKSTVVEICGDGAVTAVRLDGGDRLAADLVVVCTGVRPDLAVARSAGLQTRQGIIVNDQLQTSVPQIYAVGDVIEHRGRCYGLVAPLRDQAKVAARMIARELTGLNQTAGVPSYEGTFCMTTLKVAGVDLTSAGEFLGGHGYEDLIAADTASATYKKLVFQNDRLVGMILLGDIRDSARLFGMIRSGEDVSSSKERLMDLRATGGGRDGAQFSLTALPDSEVICNCHSVTKGTIVSTIRDKGLRSRDDVAQWTAATTGCGSCAQQVDDLLVEATKPASAVVAKTHTRPSQPVVDPLPAVKSLIGYPAIYPKSLEVERIKREGLELDFEKIREHGVMALTEDDYYRLKTYGVCSQKHPGYFMVRIRIPGGRVTHEQLIGLAKLTETHGRGWAHLTMRQSLELHWVRLEEVPSIWEHLDPLGLSTRSSCGHTMRNVMTCGHGGVSPTALIDPQPWATALTDHFLKRSDLINPTMPNRLNIYIAGCSECAPHAAINDIGIVAVKNPTSQIGFAFWAGGSLGAHPMLGVQLKAFLTPEEVLPACQAIFEIHTKYGNRNKAKSRLKHLIAQWGAEKFSAVFHRVFERRRTLPENKAFKISKTDTRSNGSTKRPSSIKQLRAAILEPLAGDVPDGYVPQRQHGYLRVTVHVPLGEIRVKQLQALASVARRYGNGIVHFTKEQDVELQWIEARWARRVTHALQQVGLFLMGDRWNTRVTACPGTEFCVLAVTNAQGAAKGLLNTLKPNTPEAAELLRNVSIAVSGCPNSCAKHQVADIGLAGTMTTVGDERRYSYLLFLGGRLDGTIRLGEVVRKGVTEEMVVPTVETLLNVVAEHRQWATADNSGGNESFQQVIDRVGTKQIGELLQQRLQPLLPKGRDKIEMVPDVLEVIS